MVTYEWEGTAHGSVASLGAGGLESGLGRGVVGCRLMSETVSGPSHIVEHTGLARSVDDTLNVQLTALGRVDGRAGTAALQEGRAGGCKGSEGDNEELHLGSLLSYWREVVKFCWCEVV